MAVTIYGVCALTFMMGMYALEGRGRGFVLAFALGCALSSSLWLSIGRLAFRRGRGHLDPHRPAALAAGRADRPGRPEPLARTFQ